MWKVLNFGRGGNLRQTSQGTKLCLSRPPACADSPEVSDSSSSTARLRGNVDWTAQDLRRCCGSNVNKLLPFSWICIRSKTRVSNAARLDLLGA